MTLEQLQAIKERVEKATPGPWVYDKGRRIGRITRRPAVIMNFVEEHDDWFIHGDISNLDDAEFIASAREDVPALIAEVERLKEALNQVERAEAKRRQEMLGWRRSWKRKRKEAKVLAKACRKHIEHAAKVEQENERLREALKQILEDEAPNCDGYETFIHATARKALAGEPNAI